MSDQQVGPPELGGQPPSGPLPFLPSPTVPPNVDSRSATPAGPAATSEATVTVETSDIVAALAEALKQVGPAAKEQEALKGVMDGLSKLGPEGLSLLAETPAFQAALERVAERQAGLADAPPGTYIEIKQGDKVRHMKKPWSRAEMMKRYPIVHNTAVKTAAVIVQGVRFDVVQGEEYDLPAIVWEVMKQSRDEEKMAGVWRDRWFGTPEKMGSSGYFGSVLLGHGYVLEPGDVSPEQIAAAVAPAAGS